MDNISHLSVPLITKGISLSIKEEYWSTDCYNLLNPKESKRRKQNKFCLCYDKTGKSSKESLQSYHPIGFYDLKKGFNEIKNEEELPYRKIKEKIVERVSI